MENRGKKDEIESPFSNPVYKRISLKNGAINKMKHSELEKLANTLKIDREGSTEILRKRLKSHYRNEFLNDAALKVSKKPYPYYIVIDFEATCEDKESPQSNYPHEIIEFPAVIVNSKTLAVVDVFHEYVKPVVNKTLTDYCTTLTGITQSQVSSADTFPSVWERFLEWLRQRKLIGRSAVVADGPWDMGHFLYRQLKLCKLPYPKFAMQWVNIKKTFANFYDQRKPSLDVMLQKLNFEFVGRRHSGIDDSRNIAKVLIQMLKDGAYVHVNEKIDLSTSQSQSERPISGIVKPVVESDISWCMDEYSKEKFNDLKSEEDNGSKEEDDVQVNEGACQNDVSDENSYYYVPKSFEKKGNVQVNQGACQNEVSSRNSSNDVLVSLENDMRAISLHLSRNTECDIH